jgi:hypothetical protein
MGSAVDKGGDGPLRPLFDNIILFDDDFDDNGVVNGSLRADVQLEMRRHLSKRGEGRVAIVCESRWVTTYDIH